MNNEIVDLDIKYFESPEFLQTDIYKVTNVRNVGDIHDISEICSQDLRRLESINWMNGFYGIYGTQPFVDTGGHLKTTHIPLVDYVKGDYFPYLIFNRITRETKTADSKEFQYDPSDHIIKVIKTEPHKLEHNTVEKAIYEKILENERLKEE
jgi:hypothetical protein